MSDINITELRQRLPYYLKQVEKGIELRITNRDKPIARIVPEKDKIETARKRLNAPLITADRKLHNIQRHGSGVPNMRGNQPSICNELDAGHGGTTTAELFGVPCSALWADIFRVKSSILGSF